MNLFGLTALEAAYTYGDRWLGEAICYVEENLKYMVDASTAMCRGPSDPA